MFRLNNQRSISIAEVESVRNESSNSLALLDYQANLERYASTMAALTPRYLTKSRFKLAMECPTKLYYTGKTNVYADAKKDNEFLQALAEGGFQVGELAKLMFPEGIEVTAGTHAQQLEETRRFLNREEVTLFEAAVQFGKLFARVDVLRKKGSRIELIEVKAKSYKSTDPYTFRGKRGDITSKMLPYLQDVAFQRYVLANAFPRLEVHAYLMLADRTKRCTVDGLNQRFEISRKNGRTSVNVLPGTSAATIGSPILGIEPVDEYVDEILTKPLEAPGFAGHLPEITQYWAQQYEADSKIAPRIGAQCAHCEFKSTSPHDTLRSGIHECWAEAKKWTIRDFAEGSVLDLSNFRRKQDLIDRGILRLRDVPLDELNGSEPTEGLSQSARQRMQVTGEWDGRPDFYIDVALMHREMKKWTFPLHFIDFETSRVAIPFFSDQHPYDNIAFQFSHHIVDHTGRIEHHNQFLEATPGQKPNYRFARELQRSLGQTGTVFMWSHHENSTLNAILEELDEDPTPPEDAADLKRFLLALTTAKKDDTGGHTGERAMVDLCRLAKLAFFHPSTKGSSSIKKILPAVMRSSVYLKAKYSNPIYGSTHGIPSKNFRDMAWWQENNSGIADPYSLLPPVFDDVPAEILDLTEIDGEATIAEGGTATLAYARLQFEEVSQEERVATERALLRYCELDTLAMVMIYEAWREWVVED